MKITHHFYAEDLSMRTLKQQELHRKCLLKIECHRQQLTRTTATKPSA